MLQHLFSEGKIGSMKTKNRVVMTAMGNHLANADGSVSERDVAFYGARAKGGVGVIITECTVVDGARGKGNNHQIRVDDERYIPGLNRLAQEVHQYGGKIIVQIYHPGRQGISAVNGNLPMMAPSEVECRAVHQPTVAMTSAEIEGMIAKFIQAAVRVKAAGIDGVEVHGAHGYLINQFLSPYTNVRIDRYGGSIENRVRFLEEIVLGIRERCGKDYPLIVRLSVDEFLTAVGQSEQGLRLEDGVEIAKRLEKLGVDAIDVSSGIYETMNVAWEPASFEQGWKLYLPETIKQAVNIPVIGVAVLRDPQYADQVIKEGKLDFVGSARQHYADPEWSNKAKGGKVAELRKCISCLHCMETLMGADLSPVPCQCGINIQAGRELEYSDLNPDGRGRIVAIIGAGPAGLEAARVLALRKYKPIVFEKTGQVGGQLELANKAPQKEKINWLINYLKRQTENLEVEIRFNTEPTVEDLKKLNPYAVFLACGSKPNRPESISGIGVKEVLSYVDILSGKIKLKSKTVAVVGSGMTGLETANLLAADGNTVSVFEMADAIGPGLYFQNLIDIMNRMRKYDVKLYPQHRLVAIRDGKAIFEVKEGDEQKEYQFEAIVIALGTKSNQELTPAIKSSFEKVYLLGDVAGTGKIRNAMEAGFITAYNL